MPIGKRKTETDIVIDRRKRKLGVIMGIGVNDIKDVNRHEKAWVAWRGMFKRCYSEITHNRNPTYVGCSVCKEWHLYSNFRKWYYDNFRPGLELELDKDILVKGNKVYSPDTCCLVPHRINCLLQKNDGLRGDLPIGVCLDHATGEYTSSMHIFNECKFIGRFKDADDAFLAYKLTKEAYIKLVATISYTNGNITERVYNALLNYKVEITD